ncbi:MAG: Stp1/IreP family PP2C-type Ser/Thr phosphatase [Myxococcota bacterium]|nr:Stp1/IreP family PP2C-type Ser/Thr phosphatase [Myxococcota bacterium]
MRITSCGITDVGERRAHNEDNFLVNDELQLFVVCDGMGGHAGGEIASAIAVHTLEEAFSSIDWEQRIKSSEEDVEEIAAEQLRFAVRLAGKRVHEIAQKEPKYQGMGTTCLAAFVDRAYAYIAHVGDSRGYLIRGARIEQLTEDHSLVNERIRAGLLTPEEAKNHKLKNIITRSLGFFEDVEIDVQSVALRKNDRILLCSDGLSNLVDPHEMAEPVLSLSLQDAARKLIHLACERGGDDNITVVLIRIDECP